jgi:hypothetical protein
MNASRAVSSADQLPVLLYLAVPRSNEFKHAIDLAPPWSAIGKVACEIHDANATLRHIRNLQAQ